MTDHSDLLAELLRATPSAWASEVRHIHDLATDRLGPYHFAGRPFLRDIIDCDAPVVVFMKSAQIGATEVAINWGLHATIQKGRDVLTVLPKDDMIQAFVKGRVDRALAQSPSLKKIKATTSNPKHKQLRDRNWYFRASNSPSELIEIPVQMIILDELDRLNPQAPDLARMRMQGCPEHLRREKMMSTPTRAGVGIDLEFQHSSRGRWHVPCAACGERQALLWEKNLVPDDDDPHWRCSKCEVRWTEAERLAAVEAGEWVHEFPACETMGFHVSALYSPTETAKSIVTKFLRAKRHDEPSKLVEFYNQVLGMPCAEGEEGLTDEDINAAQLVRPYTMAGCSSPREAVSMGVDVGPKHLHVWVLEWLSNSLGIADGCKTAALYKCTEWDDLDDLMTRHAVSCCVVDSLPEKRNAQAFQARWPGLVWLAWYHDLLPELCSWHGYSASHAGAPGPLGMKGGYVRINRTDVVDTVFARFRSPLTILLPEDLPGEARQHLKALYVVEGQDRWGHPVRRWDNGRKADHFAHAAFYAEIAGLQVGPIAADDVPSERGGSALPTSLPGFSEFGSGSADMESLTREFTGL